MDYFIFKIIILHLTTYSYQNAAQEGMSRSFNLQLAHQFHTQAQLLLIR